jgi:intracellular multiplication protein IcmL
MGISKENFIFNLANGYYHDMTNTPDKTANVNSNRSNAGRHPPVQDIDPALRDQQAAVAATLMRSAYTRERHLFLTRVIITLALSLTLSTAMNVAMAFRPPSEHFFVENQAGQIVPVVPLNEPVASDSFVETWTTNALIQANTYDFENYRTTLGQAEQYFTVPGWNSWVKALQDSGNLDAVKQNKMVASAVPLGAPVIDSSGVVNGVMTWKFEIPVELDYQVLNEKSPQRVLFLVTVVRMPIDQNPSGLGIQSISFSSLAGGS